MELAPGIFTPGARDCKTLLERLRLEPSLSGKRVLDLGARDGYFSFEMERRGAEVVAVDYMPANETGFSVAKGIIGSKIPYIHENFLRLKPSEIGQFDIVLFLGVLYHMRDPMLALSLVRSLCRNELYLETHVSDPEVGSKLPVMLFYPRNSLADDYSNYWGPNMTCVEAILEENRFQVLRSARDHDRAVFHCRVVEDQTLEYHARVAGGRMVNGTPT